MIAIPERSAARDSALEAMLPLVPAQGWSLATLRRAAGPDADLLFPGGVVDLIEAHADLVDRCMEQIAAQTDMADQRLPERVRAVIEIRLGLLHDDKDAVRRAMAYLACPGRKRVAARILARTVDAIWHAAGDRSSDFSWYSKRAILAATYSATMLFWLQDHSEDLAQTMAFVDRRLAGVARFGRFKRRITEKLPSLAA